MAKKILILRFSSMGDIVLTTPLIRNLRKAQPEARIHFVCKTAFSGLLEANPHIDVIHHFDSSPQELLNELREEDFTSIIDLQKNRKSHRLISSLGKPAQRLNKLNIRKWLYVNFGWNSLGDSHIVKRYLETGSSLGVQDDGEGLDYFIPEGTTIPQSLPVKYVLFALGGAHQGKRMTPDQWSELIAKSTHPIVLVGGKTDGADVDAMEISANRNVIDLVGQLSIHQSALLAKNAQLVVSGDTGMMHITSAFDTPIVSVWGCTVPELGMSAYRAAKGSVNIEPQHRPKRPCSKLGNRCKYGMDDKCITHVDLNEISQQINSLFQA